MASGTAIAPPETFSDVLRPIARMSDREFDVLLAAVSSPRSFSLSSKTIRETQKDLPTIGPNLAVLLAALSMLYNRLDTLAQNGADRAASVTALVRGLKVDEADQLVLTNRLNKLTAENKSYKRFRKAQRLRGGFLPNATSFQTMVDLRPDFGDDDEVEYRSLVTVIQFRVQTDSNHPSRSEFVFQLDDESLEELSKCIQRAKDKVSALKSSSALANEILEIEE